MAQLPVECLCCGERRLFDASAHSHMDAADCPRCGYVGWAATTDLNEFSRRMLRERPIERRRLRRAS
jgi:hypothetical protein